MPDVRAVVLSWSDELRRWHSSDRAAAAGQAARGGKATATATDLDLLHLFGKGSAQLRQLRTRLGWHPMRRTDSSEIGRLLKGNDCNSWQYNMVSILSDVRFLKLGKDVLISLGHLSMIKHFNEIKFSRQESEESTTQLRMLSS